MLSRLMAIVLLGVASPAGFAEQAADEYAVKGAFLINFTKFVTWPPQVFKAPRDPIAICVLGENPFGPGLDRAARETVAGRRNLTVRQVADGPEASQCQIVFIGASERKRSRGWLDELRDASVLTVGESDSFLASGGIIDFALDGSKVRIEISTAAADRVGIQISAKLLSLAQLEKK